MEEEQDSWGLPETIHDKIISEIDTKIERIIESNKEALRALVSVREDLDDQSLINRIDFDQDSVINKVYAVDGANSKILQFAGWTFSACCANAYSEHPELEMLNDGKGFSLPVRPFLHRYISAYRTQLEWKLVVDSLVKSDLVIWDGTFMDPMNWHYRIISEEMIFERFEEYPDIKDVITHSIESYFKKITVPNVISIPKRISSGAWSKSRVKQDLLLNDRVILSYLLEENEYTFPEVLIKFERWSADTIFGNDFADNIQKIYFTYFKPTKAPNVLRIEFHEDRIRDLDSILCTIKSLYDPLSGQIHPMVTADRLSKGIRNIPYLLSDILRNNIISQVIDDKDLLKLIEIGFAGLIEEDFR